MNIPLFDGILWVVLVATPAPELQPNDFVLDESIEGVAELFHGDSFQWLGAPEKEIPNE